MSTGASRHPPWSQCPLYRPHHGQTAHRLWAVDSVIVVVRSATASTNTPHRAGEHMTAEHPHGDRLTVAGLLDESLMSGARVIAGQDHLGRELHWVLPLSEVLSRHEPLDGVAV